MPDYISHRAELAFARDAATCSGNTNIFFRPVSITVGD